MKTVSVSLVIRIHDDGSVDATHAPSTNSDVETLATMRFGGQDVVAAALMGEAVRRQSNLMVGLVAATDPARMNLIRAGDVKETAAVAAQTLRVLTEVAEQVAPSAVIGAIRDVTGAKDSTGG